MCLGQFDKNTFVIGVRVCVCVWPNTLLTPLARLASSQQVSPRRRGRRIGERQPPTATQTNAHSQNAGAGHRRGRGRPRPRSRPPAIARHRSTRPQLQRVVSVHDDGAQSDAGTRGGGQKRDGRHADPAGPGSSHGERGRGKESREGEREKNRSESTPSPPLQQIWFTDKPARAAGTIDNACSCPPRSLSPTARAPGWGAPRHVGGDTRRKAHKACGLVR